MIKKIIVGILIIFLIGSSYSMATVAMNNPPNIPSEPNPEDDAIDVGIKTHISWKGGDPDQGDTPSYNVYFGTNAEPELLASDLQMPNYNLGILEKNTQYFWKIVAIDESQASSEGPVWSFTTNDCDCDPPEQPNGPNKARHRHRYEYTTRLNLQNQNGIYYNFSWGDGNCSGWLGPYNHNERVRAEHEWHEPGEYQVQTRARFQNNLISFDEWTTTGWSEPLIVTVSDESENEAPTVPTIQGTTNGKIGEVYDYTFSATDPDGDDVFYFVEFCEGCGDAQWHGPYQSGYELTLSHQWSEEGTFNIKAKAKDSFDAESDWGTLTVTMPRNRVVNRPILIFLEQHPILYQLLLRFLQL